VEEHASERWLGFGANLHNVAWCDESGGGVCPGGEFVFELLELEPDFLDDLGCLHVRVIGSFCVGLEVVE
jgi:hypothetical protein